MKDGIIVRPTDNIVTKNGCIAGWSHSQPPRKQILLGPRDNIGTKR